VPLPGRPNEIHHCRLLAGILLEHLRLRPGSIRGSLPPVVLDELLSDLIGGERDCVAGIITFLNGQIGQRE